MGFYNGTTKLQQYTEELWNDYTNDEDIVIRKSNNNLNKPKKAKKISIPQKPKKKVQQPTSPVSESKDLNEIKDFLEDNLAVGFGNLVPSTFKKRVRNRKPKAKKQNSLPINLQEELNKADDGWETMLYKKNKRELNQLKREAQKEIKIQNAQKLNIGFVRHNRNTSVSTESEYETKASPTKRNTKSNVKNTKLIKKQLDQQIELQKQRQLKKNEMEKWNKKLENEKKRQQAQLLKDTRRKESAFSDIIQERQQMKVQIKVENAKNKSNKSKQPQSPNDKSKQQSPKSPTSPNDIQKMIQKQLEQDKQQKQQELLKAQKEKKHDKLMRQNKHAQMQQRAANKAKK